jgi:hypothetical protein
MANRADQPREWLTMTPESSVITEIDQLFMAFVESHLDKNDDITFIFKTNNGMWALLEAFTRGFLAHG